MKKTNKKGFTLVELVVVGTMMVIILGAILNLLEPINNFYKNVQTTANSNDIGNLTMKYLEGELRYSTEVLVIEDFKGMPLVNNGRIVISGGEDLYSTYTDCIIVENNPDVLRGDINGAVIGDTGDPNIGHRKGAFGQLYSVHLNDAGQIDPDDIKIALGEEVYDEYSYQFTIRGPQKTITTNKVLDVTMNVYKPEYTKNPGTAEAGDIYTVNGYHYNTNNPTFTQQRSLELMNINQIGQGFRLFYVSDSPDVSGVDHIPNIAKATGAGGEMWKTSLYSGTEPHTFIFYRKDPEPKVANQVTVSLDDGSSFTLTKGATIPPKYGKFPDDTDSTTWDAASWYLKSTGNLVSFPDGTVREEVLREITEPVTGMTLQQWIVGAQKVNTDTNFVREFDYVVKATPSLIVRLYDRKSDYNAGLETPKKFCLYAPGNMLPTELLYSDYIQALPTEGSARDMRPVYWSYSADAEFTNDIHYNDYSGVVALYAVERRLPKKIYRFATSYDIATDTPTYDDSADNDNFRDNLYIVPDRAGSTPIPDTAIISSSQIPDFDTGDPDKVFVGWQGDPTPPDGFNHSDMYLPKKGGLMKSTYWGEFGTFGDPDETIYFKPIIVDKHEAYLTTAYTGFGSGSNMSERTTTITIYNSGDRTVNEEIAVTFESPVDLNTVDPHITYTDKYPVGDARHYLMKFNVNLTPGEKFSIPVTVKTTSDYGGWEDYNQFHVTVEPKETAIEDTSSGAPDESSGPEGP